MSDKPKQCGERGGDRIDVSQESECHYWSGKFGVTPERIKQIVRQVGPMVSDVQRRLRDQAEEPRSS